MKKIKILLMVALCLGVGPQMARAAESVPVTLPTFDVTLNGVKLDQSASEYPLLLYKDITYVPMTYYDAKLLGLTPNWSLETGFSLDKAPLVLDGETARSQYQPYLSGTKNQSAYQATLATFQVRVSANAIDNAKEPYPLLVFRDVTYFPLTWRFAVDEFGWQYHFDLQTGLVITPVPTVVTPPQTNGPTTVVVTGNVVNIRSGPDTTFATISQVVAGDSLKVIGTQGEWYQVRLANGKEGWIANWLVKESSSGEEVISKGPPNALIFNQFVPGVDKSLLSLGIGKNNQVQVQKSTATQMVLTIDNNHLNNFTTVLSQLNTAQGPISRVQINSEGTNTLRLTLDLRPGAYCTVKTVDGELTINGYSRNLTKGEGLQGKVIVLDPGHGGTDMGATGLVLKLTDRDVGWAVAEQLKPLLEAKGAIVLLTRPDNMMAMALNQRAPVANRVEADAFISIHADSVAPNTQPSGRKVFYYAPSTTPTLATQKYVRLELAQCIEEGVLSQTGRPGQVQTANYAVLRENDRPCVLVETGFLSNAQEEALLATDAYRLQIAQGICQGLEKYFNMY